MNYRQNEKIAQVTERTLVIGVDIAKTTHYARAFNYRGQEIHDGYKKVLKFNNHLEGFTTFRDWINVLMESYDMDQVLIAMEPTGHYWFNLRQFCITNELKVVLVNPHHVKKTKELDDNSPTKNDRKDPKTIAMLVIVGRYSEPYFPEGVYADYREIMKAYERINNGVIMVKNRIIGWLDEYFPEFTNVFTDIEGRTAMKTLREFPLPAKIIEFGAENILAEWKTEVKRGIGIKRAKELVNAAQESVGSVEGTTTAIMSLEMLLDEYDLYKSQYDKTLVTIERLLSQIPYADKIIRIKGIGIITAAGIIAEIGDISRFDDAKQVIKYAGLNLVENSSGKHKGKTRISKRGRRQLRSVLFRAMMPLVSKNDEFKELHNYYTSRSENPMKKKQSIIVLCCKLIRVLFAMMTKNIDYSGEKLINDIHRPIAEAA
jgi:transposase